jgi:thiol-disulfide isomerase/thioredoxin
MILRPLFVVLLAVLLVGCADQPQPAPVVESGGSPLRESVDGAVTSLLDESAADTSDASPAAPQVKILTHDEIQQLIASHNGKVVVMDCWSTSCEPCVKEFPNLVALHKKYGPEKVACISLSFDYEGLGKPEDVLPVVQDFVEKQGATFDNVLCRDDSETLYKKMNLASVPAVYVYKRDGELAKRFDNEDAKKPEDAFNYEHVGKLVEQLVEGK